MSNLVFDDNDLFISKRQIRLKQLVLENELQKEILNTVESKTPTTQATCTVGQYAYT